ncbi:MAG: N-acetyltransferase [Chloroflexi bacterium]|nr:N-acetyltransferase [Chloroflexota bacterium]GIW09108.1 MAG: acetyltransferase [Dehalococcoidia bacterium]
MADIPQIHKLISYYADRGDLLPRSLHELYETARDFFVVRNEEGQVIGCAALHINWSDLAELRSVAVAEPYQGRGISRLLAEAALEEARQLGIRTVYVLTYRPEVFSRFGFRTIDVAQLPRKVWSECHRCPKFQCCDEIAMVCDVLERERAARDAVPVSVAAERA